MFFVGGWFKDSLDSVSLELKLIFSQDKSANAFNCQPAVFQWMHWLHVGRVSTGTRGDL